MPRLTNRKKTRMQLLREVVRSANLDFDAVYLLVQDSIVKSGIAPTGQLDNAPVNADLTPEMRTNLTSAISALDAAVAAEEAKA